MLITSHYLFLISWLSRHYQGLCPIYFWSWLAFPKRVLGVYWVYTGCVLVVY